MSIYNFVPFSLSPPPYLFISPYLPLPLPLFPSFPLLCLYSHFSLLFFSPLFPRLLRVPTIKSLERYPVLPDQNYMKITSIIENMDGDWDFDIFEFEKISGGRPILFAGFSIIQKYGISAKWNIEEAKLRTFLICIEGGYFSNP